MHAPPRFLRRMIPAIVVALCAYVAICALLYFLQERLVFFPDRSLATDPRSLGLSFEELDLVTSDAVHLHGWYLPAEEPLGALVFCHGNAGNISHRLAAAQALHAMRLSVLLFDYRGYGKSEGSPSEEGTYRDGEAAYEFLRSRGFAPERIALYGESLGGAVAIELARRRKVACAVIESTFTSLPDMGAAIYRWLPVRLLARIHYDNRAKVAALDVPLLLIHSPEDEIVPFRHAERLVEAAREPRQLLVTAGSHNSGGFLGREEWRARVREFLWSSLPER